MNVMIINTINTINIPNNNTLYVFIQTKDTRKNQTDPKRNCGHFALISESK